MQKSLLAGLIASLFSTSALALDPFVVKDIRVEGIQRTEAGTVFSYLPVKVGDTINDEKAAAAIKALFATGFFKDVRLEFDKDVLVVVVEERPAIAQIDLTGLKEFDKDAVKKVMREGGLAESRIFDRALLEKAEQELKRQYLAKGRYAVEVVTTVTPLERNRVALNFAVDEGEVAKIKQINIVGNKAFKEGDLTDLFALRSPGWFTWYTKNDQYSKQKLSGDIETLRSFYLNQGYLEFNVDSTQVSITPDKRDIYITISLTEGEKFTVSDVKLAGQMLVPENELKELITLKTGDVFSREKLTETTKAITDRLGNEGYAFANANAAPEVDREKRTVAFTILLDPGRRVYVRRINVSGNTKTRDEVVRRELRQLEGGWYNAELINKSRSRVDKTGFFDEVNVETPPVTGTPDQVDVNLSVKEKATGNLLLGAGFSSEEKLVLTTSVSQQNLFGTGNALSLSLNTGKVNKTVALSFTEPYYTVDGVSRGFDIYKRNTDAAATGTGDYKTSTLGGGVRFGYPLTEIDNVGFGMNGEITDISVGPQSPQQYIDFTNIYGSKTKSLMGTVGWDRDTVDSRLYPTKGVIQGAGLETSLPAGNLRFYRLNYKYQRFVPLTRKYTLAFNGEAAVAGGFSGKPVPFYKTYTLGGISSVRGYDSGTLGPKDINGNALGGTRRLLGNVEFLFPLPGSGLDKSVRLGTFLDGGQVYGADEKIRLGALRYSTGLGVTWTSPMGPLKFAFVRPLNKKEGDKTASVQFQLGSQF